MIDNNIKLNILSNKELNIDLSKYISYMINSKAINIYELNLINNNINLKCRLSNSNKDIQFDLKAEENKLIPKLSSNIDMEDQKEIKSILEGSKVSSIPNTNNIDNLSFTLLSEDEIMGMNTLIGSDESGKGDYFGPLVVASCAIKPKRMKDILAIDIKENKLISDMKCKKIARTIKPMLYFHIKSFNPKEYNALYKEHQNINRILESGHIECINSVHNQSGIQNALIDQFTTKQFMYNKLMKLNIKVKEYTKAERNLVVACASILARNKLIEIFHELSNKFNIKIPKGGGGKHISETINTLVKKHGYNIIYELVKVHFRNTKSIKIS